jgi:protein-tyrosine phosphatase
MAEAVFKDLVAQAGLSDSFQIDSVGTGDYHVGDSAHSGTRKVLAAHNIRCDSISRQLNRTDLSQADYLIAMDYSNQSDVQALARRYLLKGELDLLLNFAENAPVNEVPDPYYTGDFEGVYQLVKEGCEGLLAHIRAEQGI